MKTRRTDPRKRWVLMVDDRDGPRWSNHNGHGLSPRAKVEMVLNGSAFEGLKPLQRDILLKRAEHDPASFKIEGDSHPASGQGRVTYWFELREV